MKKSVIKEVSLTQSASVVFTQNVVHLSVINTSVETWMSAVKIKNIGLPSGPICQEYNISYHSYADDTELYLPLEPLTRKTTTMQLRLFVTVSSN